MNWLTQERKSWLLVWGLIMSWTLLWPYTECADGFNRYVAPRLIASENGQFIQWSLVLLQALAVTVLCFVCLVVEPGLFRTQVRARASVWAIVSSATFLYVKADTIGFTTYDYATGLAISVWLITTFVALGIVGPFSATRDTGNETFKVSGNRSGSEAG